MAITWSSKPELKPEPEHEPEPEPEPEPKPNPNPKKPNSVLYECRDIEGSVGRPRGGV